MAGIWRATVATWNHCAAGVKRAVGAAGPDSYRRREMRVMPRQSVEVFPYDGALKYLLRDTENAFCASTLTTTTIRERTCRLMAMRLYGVRQSLPI